MAMKKWGCMIWVIILIHCLLLPVNAGKVPYTYTDYEANVTFTVPAGWSEEENEIVDACFFNDVDSGCMIVYDSHDVWGEIPEDEKIGYSRSEFNNSIFSISDLSEVFGVPSNQITIVRYGSITYYKIINYAPAGDTSLKLTRFLYIENGWRYDFELWQQYDNNEQKYYNAFEILIRSVKYPTVSTSPNSDSYSYSNPYPDLNTYPYVSSYSDLQHKDKYDFKQLFILFTITALVCTVPLLIYRVAIRKRPLRKEISVTIIFVYSLILFLCMQGVYGISFYDIINYGICLSFWAFINYKILTEGEDKHTPKFEYKENDYHGVSIKSGNSVYSKMESNSEKADEKNSVKTIVSSIENNNVAKKVQFCRECGAKLVEESKFCVKCGAKIKE